MRKLNDVSPRRPVLYVVSDNTLPLLTGAPAVDGQSSHSRFFADRFNHGFWRSFVLFVFDMSQHGTEVFVLCNCGMRDPAFWVQDCVG